MPASKAVAEADITTAIDETAGIAKNVFSKVSEVDLVDVLC